MLFKGRYSHGAVINDDEIYIYGGRDEGVCDDILHLDLKGKTWNKKKVNGFIFNYKHFNLFYFN